jgi:WXG100 family type VII secretion target
MSRIAVDVDALAELIDRLAAFEAQLVRTRAEVDARVQALHVTWSGDSAAAQASAHERWQRGAAQVHEALADLRAIVCEARANYASALAANRRMWAG